MSETNPEATATENPDTTVSTPTTPAVDVEATGTGNPADAAPVESNPTDSSSVSDEEGVQSAEYQEQEAEQQAKRDEVAEAQQEHQLRTTPEVDHEGTGTGTGVVPPGDYDGEPDGTDAA